MSSRIDKPWIPLDRLDPKAVPAQLGVFELGDDDGVVLHIGRAGGREPFGLRSAVSAAVARATEADWGPAAGVRWELTHGYLSRHRELLMVHVHDHGRGPVGTPVHQMPVGRLTPPPAPGR
ncbi:MAG: hypothetical protein AAGD35_13435 [Actinomycetota bacterium]